MSQSNKSYIGDGVYLTVESAYEIILTTEDGVSTSNTIYLDISMAHQILETAKQVLESRVRVANAEHHKNTQPPTTDPQPLCEQ